MWMVVRMNYEKDCGAILFESDSYMDCEVFIRALKDKDNIEICEKY